MSALVIAALMIASPNCVLSKAMNDVAGSGARACADVACAKDAFDRKQPFTMCRGGFGMDSYIENGVAGLANGNLQFFYLDTFGPRTRGLCLRPNVSFVAGEWPACKAALIDEIDLTTGRAPVEPKAPYEEPWPESCRARALRAPQWPIGVELFTGENPIPDPERWGMTCRNAIVSFQMLIDKTGRVQCVRIRSVGLHAPPPGLYDSVRARLLRWRFKPPLLHGEPIDVRWGMQINTITPGERLPGPPIYPVCPRF